MEKEKTEVVAIKMAQNVCMTDEQIQEVEHVLREEEHVTHE